MPSLPCINLASAQIIGNKTPQVIFYLPNPPLLDDNWQADDIDSVDKLITLNGNHWRKIMVIASKIVAVNLSDWRDIKATLLSNIHLSSSAQLKCAFVIVPLPSSGSETKNNIMSSKNLNDDTNDIEMKQVWHIICGLETLKRLGYQPHQFSHSVSFKQQQTLYYQDKLIFTPYLDYRQFPNGLIELARQIIHST